MSRFHHRTVPFLVAVLVALSVGCSKKSTEEASDSNPTAKDTPTAEKGSEQGIEAHDTAPVENSETGAVTSKEPALLLSYSQFVVKDGAATAEPGPAMFEILRQTADGWKSERFEDKDSNVFHKAMPFQNGVLTLGGSGAFVKLWTFGGDKPKTEVLWTEKFGGKFDRMRDAEIADLYGDGKEAIAVATHDQGVVAVLRRDSDSWKVERIDKKPNTFVHEIEIGDLDGDRVLEVYATPSDPNKLDAEAQHGEVVRYVPKLNQGRKVVADLGDRHAKEILVDDVDGDGRDELYVAVEAKTSGGASDVKIESPVEIRRYDAGTDPKAGVVIATLPDRLCRFLTAGDIDGDGKKELVAAAFSSGLWLLRPGTDPKGAWSKESIDKNSGGFEHAALLSDLDGDGRAELYVAADNEGELRRYVWKNGRPKREVIEKRDIPMARMTWNIVPFR
ncbi:MAG: VCBS repeat-containing protein [Polyangiales bacterium]